MSARFLDLVALFEQACALNREALAALRAGTPLPELEGLFRRKQALSEALGGELEGRELRSGGPQDEGVLARVLDLQREAALLEVQVAEALGNLVPRSGNAAAAYKKSVPGGPKEGLDRVR